MMENISKSLPADKPAVLVGQFVFDPPLLRFDNPVSAILIKDHLHNIPLKEHLLESSSCLVSISTPHRSPLLIPIIWIKTMSSLYTVTLNLVDPGIREMMLACLDGSPFLVMFTDMENTPIRFHDITDPLVSSVFSRSLSGVPDWSDEEYNKALFNLFASNSTEALRAEALRQSEANKVACHA